MTKSIACLLAAFAVSLPLPAQPATGPCQVCASGESPVRSSSSAIDHPGYLVAVERTALTGGAADGKRPANGNASTTLEKAEAVPSLNSGWKSDFRAPPGATQSTATVPARFTTPGVGLQSPSIKDPHASAEANRHSGEWLEVLPEWHAGWALIIGLLVVALRRVPIRFRSNGL